MCELGFLHRLTEIYRKLRETHYLHLNRRISEHVITFQNMVLLTAASLYD